eukprot:4056537-Amphidinium_carterae.1
MEVQEHMGFGDNEAEIIELEADEISVGKRGVDGRPDRVVWLSYVGIVRRGHGCSLVLHRLPDRET